MPTFAPSRRRAFFAGLAATGNLTAAAERARVSRSWVMRLRAVDADFRAESDAAIAEARARLLAADGCGAPKGWGFLDGVQMVVVRGGHGRKVQVARAKPGTWTPKAEDRFLSVLAATCNVTVACAAAGIRPKSAYNHRRTWPGFAARWRAALEQGYLRLEAGLLECGGNVFSGEEVPPECPVHSISADQAIHLLWLHRAEVRGVGERPGRRWWRKERPIEEVRASLIRKVEAIVGMREIPEDVRAEDRAAWGARRPEGSG